MGWNKIPQYLSLGVSTLLNQKVSFIKKNSNHWEIRTNSFLLKSKILVLTMPINQVSELLKASDIALTDMPTAKYKSFYTITFQNMNAIGSKSILKNDFAPWICNNLLKGLSIDQNIFTVNINEELSNIKKSIVLPLGEVKLTRKIQSLSIIFRTNTNIEIWDQNKKRIFEKPKIEYALRLSLIHI